jgi:Outer membrane protein beta-barrel domain
MNLVRKSLPALAAMLLLGAASLRAQHPQVREGFWIGFGLGYGPFDVSCTGCGSVNSESNFTGHLRLGGTLKPNLLLGGDMVAWAKSEAGLDQVAGNITAAAYYYPMERSGLFLKGGVGFASYHASGGGNTADGNGVGITLGAGYDIRVGRNISITPVGSFLFGSVGDIQVDGTTIASGWKQTIFEFGLDVTFH